MKRRILTVLLIIVLLFTLVVGLKNGISDFSNAVTNGQKLCSVFGILNGIVSVISLFALWRKRSWLNPLMILWGITLTATATLAPVVWGETGIFTGIASGGSTLLIALFFLWIARTITRP